MESLLATIISLLVYPPSGDFTTHVLVAWLALYQLHDYKSCMNVHNVCTYGGDGVYMCLNLHSLPPLSTSTQPPLSTSTLYLHSQPPLNLLCQPPLSTSTLNLRSQPPLSASTLNLHSQPPLSTSTVLFITILCILQILPVWDTIYTCHTFSVYLTYFRCMDMYVCVFEYCRSAVHWRVQGGIASRLLSNVLGIQCWWERSTVALRVWSSISSCNHRAVVFWSVNRFPRLNSAATHLPVLEEASTQQLTLLWSHHCSNHCGTVCYLLWTSVCVDK